MLAASKRINAIEASIFIDIISLYLPQRSSLLHQPYQTRLSRGIRCKCLNVRRFKRGGEAAKHAPVCLARHWLTVLSSCLTLARGDERAIFIIHSVSSF